VLALNNTRAPTPPGGNILSGNTINQEAVAINDNINAAVVNAGKNGRGVAKVNVANVISQDASCWEGCSGVGSVLLVGQRCASLSFLMVTTAESCCTTATLAADSIVIHQPDTLSQAATCWMAGTAFVLAGLPRVSPAGNGTGRPCMNGGDTLSKLAV
jgi:hypothetical protein